MPKGLLKAYNERKRGAHAASTPGGGRERPMSARPRPDAVVTQVKSGRHAKPKTRGTLRALGLGRIGKRNTLPDRPEIRGMIARVPHLVEVRRQGEGRCRT